jgi:Ribose/xylose/arabinose/galactoside ABC-type transport systems, permease components
MSTQSPARTPDAKAGGGGARDVIRFLLRFQSAFGLVAVLLISALASPVRDGRVVFLEPSNLLNIVRFASENGIMAVGMTLVILTGGIDLSVGAVLALSGVGAAAFLMRYDQGVAVTVGAVLALGGLVGALSGLVTTRLKVPSFITTLAVLSAARGAASLWSGGYAIPLAFGPDAAPPLFKSLFGGQLTLGTLAIPAPLFYFLGVGLIANAVLRRTVFGRYVYATGGNEAATRLAGVNTDRIKVAVFAASGALAALAALLHVALVNQGSHIDGGGYELNAIAAAVIGGTSLSGGVGTIGGTVIGALILSVLDNILGLRNVPSDYQLILKGVIIVLAVVLQRQRRPQGAA